MGKTNRRQFWNCENCGEQNHVQDATCQYCDSCNGNHSVSSKNYKAGMPNKCDAKPNCNYVFGSMD